MEIVLIACLKYRGKLPMLHDSSRRAIRDMARDAPKSRMQLP
jgi:hypothetical protein